MYPLARQVLHCDIMREPNTAMGSKGCGRKLNAFPRFAVTKRWFLVQQMELMYVNVCLVGGSIL